MFVFEEKTHQKTKRIQQDKKKTKRKLYKRKLNNIMKTLKKITFKM
jgi:hypothetical protein